MIDAMSFPLVIRDAMSATRDLDGTLLMSEDEFRAFYERTARPLWAYLSRITGDSHKADDFLQEAYYRFYRAGAKHENESHRRNSLFRIATNLVRDAARQRKHVQEVALAPDDSALTLQITPEHQMAMKTDLARALDRLEPSQRQLLWLAYAQGLPHQEIASILGLRAISVRTLLLRARRKLAGFLGGGAA